MAYIIDGKTIAKKIREELAKKVAEFNNVNKFPSLAVIIVGNDPASRVYVNSKKKACEEIGIKSIEYALDENITESELLKVLETLNNDAKVNGILIQLPLPKDIDCDKILNSINPIKDVDCFHPNNVGKIMTGNPVLLPCTPHGVIEIIERSGVEISGKECVVVGRSNIVGKPVAMLLLSKNGTVTVCHSKTKDLKAVCKRADILVAAIGKPEFITAEYIKEGAVVIDVGVNRLENGKLVGDVNFKDASRVASFVTPVPGGVGPMTIAMLMKNTVMAFEMQN
jgi:methylenetetrahydrofolate dehydrogenase (NADP+)/methenyltetrahydrofolate cyclohydrolase